MATELYYNYAVIDPSYPFEPHFWSLAGFSFGDAGEHGWSSEFAPGATANSMLLRANLGRKKNRISLALEASAIGSTEPVWRAGVSFDQVILHGESDMMRSRKIALYHVRTLRVGTEKDSYRHHIFNRPMRIVIAEVTRGGYVAVNGSVI
jgi:hypothetical protein